MNKKNKVLLSTVGLLLLSGIAATSSTFAWFTTVRNASINYNKATASTDSGNLKLSYVTSLNTVSQTTTENDIVITGANAVTDISGDGANFYKPVWANQTDYWNGVASVINALPTADEGDADGYFVDFTVKVERDNDADANGLKVYLGAGTVFTDTKSETDPEDDVDIVPALRLAVLDDAGEVILRWAPIAEANAKHLVSGAPDSGTVYGLTSHKLVDETAATLKTGAITTETTITAADAAGFLVADLSTEVEAVITFRAWIEGTDAQTVNAIIGETFSLDIKLYALEVIA